MNSVPDNSGGRHIKSSIGIDMLVQDVMTKDVLSITKYESIMRVADILAEKNISGLPVVDNETKVVGIIRRLIFSPWWVWGESIRSRIY